MQIGILSGYVDKNGVKMKHRHKQDHIRRVRLYDAGKTIAKNIADIPDICESYYEAMLQKRLATIVSSGGSLGDIKLMKFEFHDGSVLAFDVYLRKNSWIPIRPGEVITPVDEP
jgi:lysyl-tRNA synthetase class I